MIKEPKNLEVKNAVIERASLTTENDGILTAFLNLDCGKTSPIFYRYGLYLPKSFTCHSLKSFAGHFIFRVMEIAGVENWDELPGKTIRVRHNDGAIWEIGHIINDDWFCPERDFEPVTSRNNREDKNETKDNA